MNPLSNLGTSFDNSCLDESFQSFKKRLKNTQDLIAEYNSKIIEKSLCSDDLDRLQNEMKKLTILNDEITRGNIKYNYVLYKSLYLNIVQDSYRLCNWVLDKNFKDMDDVFKMDSFVDKILNICAGKENPLDHLNILFSGVLKNSNNFDLNFYGNIQSTDIDDSITVKQNKRGFKRSQKVQLEELVVPDEIYESAESGVNDNELQLSLKRVHRCLVEAVSNNRRKPICFFKFAIDPFSITYTVQNLFNLASLVKDNVAKIKTVPDNGHDEFITITVVKKKNKDNNKGKTRSSIFSINNNLWEFYKKKYNITERMIEQDE